MHKFHNEIYVFLDSLVLDFHNRGIKRKWLLHGFFILYTITFSVYFTQYGFDFFKCLMVFIMLLLLWINNNEEENLEKANAKRVMLRTSTFNIVIDYFLLFQVLMGIFIKTEGYNSISNTTYIFAVCFIFTVYTVSPTEPPKKEEKFTVPVHE